MTVIGAAALIGLAVWMVMPPATRKQEGRHLPAWSGVPVGFVAAWLLFGAGGVVWAVMAVAVGQTVLVVVRRQRRRAQILKGGREVTRATRALAGRVSVGEIPAVALEHVASDVEVLAQARRAQAVGGSVPDALMATSRQPGMAGLVPLAHAWHLAATTRCTPSPSGEIRGGRNSSTSPPGSHPGLRTRGCSGVGADYGSATPGRIAHGPCHRSTTHGVPHHHMAGERLSGGSDPSRVSWGVVERIFG